MGKHKEKSKKQHKRDKKHKKDKKKHQKRTSGSNSTSSEEWVEKESYSSLDDQVIDDNSSVAGYKTNETCLNAETTREGWMSLPTSFLTESNLEKRKNKEESKKLEREKAQYNPREHVKELNPYWKDGGDGLPKFKKPADNESNFQYESSKRTANTLSHWRKKPVENICQSFTNKEPEHEMKEVTTKPSLEILSDKEMNILASKLVKAEIMGKTELVKELKEKLEHARKLHKLLPDSEKPEEIILTQTDSRGQTRPLRLQSDYGEFSGCQRKKKKVETHQDGQRVRYFADDDKHSLQQMFENEKYHSTQDQDFMKMASRVKSRDDLDEMFADNIRRESDDKIDLKNKHKAIHEHQRVTKSVDNCRYCLQSNVMQKHLMVTFRETCFLSLPSHEPLTKGHCLIVPIRHVSCSTQLDENEWVDIMDLRKTLTRMFHSKNKDVIFFETAKNFERFTHMYIECVPLDKEEGNMASIYFKKAIDECEHEWTHNKKLVLLKDKNVRKAIPKGLSYFFVSFGMDEGYAHVIEEQKSFPDNFAQEVIGGMLDLHHSKWRKPKQQTFQEQSQRVLEFSQQWDPFDDTRK